MFLRQYFVLITLSILSIVVSPALCEPPWTVDLDIHSVPDADEEDPGGFVPLNDDDDNNNSTPDKDENPVTGEDDLVHLWLTRSAQDPGTGTIRLSLTETGNGRIKVWDNATKTGTPLITHDDTTKTWTPGQIPTSGAGKLLYVEGVTTSSTAGDVTLTLTWVGAPPNPDPDDKVSVTVVQVHQIERDIAGGAVDYQLITDTNRNVLPGQKMNLRLRVTPANADVEWEWTLPGITFKNYTANQTEGILTKIYSEDGDEKEISYYWADTADSRNVTCNVTISWIDVIRAASFNVKKPTCTYSRTIGDAGINGAKTWIGLYAGGGMTDGIEFSAKVEVPAGFNEGKWNYVQLIKGGRKATKDDDVVVYRAAFKQSCLDTRYPAKPSPYTAHPGTAGSWTTGAAQRTLEDTPEASLPATGYKGRDVDKEEFWTYVMFLPPGEETRYVPSKKVYWWWEASATKGATEWSLDQGSDNEHADGPVETTAHPTWAFNVNDDTSYYAKGSLTMTLPEDVTEGGGTVQATVSVMANVTANLTVNLTSSDTSEITVPSTVTITSGHNSVNFNITIVNDATKDGTQTAFVTCTATGYANGKGGVAIRDNE